MMQTKTAPYDVAEFLETPEEMAAYLSQAHASGRIEVADPAWAARRLLAAVMPPLPMMCAGFEPLQPPSIDEVRRAVQFFLRGIAADQPSKL